MSATFKCFFMLPTRSKGEPGPGPTLRTLIAFNIICMRSVLAAKQIKSRNKLEKYNKNEENPEMFAEKTIESKHTHTLAVVDFLQSALFWSFVENCCRRLASESKPSGAWRAGNGSVLQLWPQLHQLRLLPTSSVWDLGSTTCKPTDCSLSAASGHVDVDHYPPLASPCPCLCPCRRRRHLATHSWHSRLISDVRSRKTCTPCGATWPQLRLPSSFIVSGWPKMLCCCSSCCSCCYSSCSCCCFVV